MVDWVIVSTSRRAGVYSRARMANGNLFTSPARLPLIAPSILSADFAVMGAECRGVLEAGADLLHLDVMDGHFVPNLTMGPDLCRCLRRALPGAFLDVHLMVTDPGRFVEPFHKAGANHLTFHVEVAGGKAGRELASRIRGLGMTAGIAVNPETPVDGVLELLDAVDLVLVMSVHPGYSGQAFIGEVLRKTEGVHSRLRPDQRLEMDGGISPSNVASVRKAGCDVIVAATAIFGLEPAQRAGAIGRLRA